MATTATERKLLLDGAWIETGDWVDVASPYDGLLVARVAKAGAAETRAAIDAAERAMREPLPAHKRAEILVRVAGALGRRADEAARQIAAEAGKPLKAARVEVARAMSTYTMAAVEARKLVGASGDIGDVLVEVERVALITFPGSGAVGWGIRERAARKRVNLELGNATPVIVEADADVEDAAARCAANAFSFAGQSCISVQRIFVQETVYDRFRDAFLPRVEALVVGDPAEEETDVGPLISASERERVLAWVDEARGRGATIM